MHLVHAVAALFGVLAQVAKANDVSDALSATPTATIAPGPIIGTTTSIAGPTGSVAVNKFLGIPFSTPPTGQNRFSPPQPPAPWTTPLVTDHFSPACIQVFNNAPPAYLRNFTEQVFNNPPPAEDEDCLYLNVFAPKKAWDPNAPPFAVMFWMYGGGWEFGNAGQPIYDGSHFAALEDVVLVGVNYRTNMLGLPQTPAIGNLTNRNLALLDQRAGLDWVQTNIHHFGGNNASVTIFGESAGSFAVDALITSYAPGAPRPFHAGIMESGTYAYVPAGNCTNDDYSGWNALARNLSCTGTDEQIFNCIKNERTAKEIKLAQENNGLNVYRACDDVTFVSDPRNRLEHGNTADVPVILGTNTADGSFYTIIYGFNTQAYFDTWFPGNTALRDAALNEYKAYTDAQIQLQQIHTDWFFHCPAVWYGETSAKWKPTYRYLFNATFTNTRAQAPTWPVAYQGAYHSSEIPIVFTFYDNTIAPPDAGEDSLSNTMRHAWAKFAKNPNEAPITGWPLAQNEADVWSFGIDTKAQNGPYTDVHHCDFWRLWGFREVHAK